MVTERKKKIDLEVKSEERHKRRGHWRSGRGVAEDRQTSEERRGRLEGSFHGERKNRGRLEGGRVMVLADSGRADSSTEKRGKTALCYTTQETDHMVCLTACVVFSVCVQPSQS